MAELWWVYIIEKNGKLYTGITTDLYNRMCQHGKSTPAYTEGTVSRTEAAKRERQIKGWGNSFFQYDGLVRPGSNHS
jgi:predicted GIY-YIG superfamily endonuclease